MMRITDIKPNPSNPRHISDDKLKKLMQSIKEFPKMMELRPIVLDSNNIILGGNMRYRALSELGYKDIPKEWIKKASDLTPDEVRRFIIADNVGYGEWDYDLLHVDWTDEELEGWGMDIPRIEMFEGDIDDFFEENDKQAREKELLCPHCGKNIYESEEKEEE